jgi:cysteine desulfurase
MGIYLDNAATTALDDRVLNAMVPFWQKDFGNPSSSHAPGRHAKDAVEKSRQTIADIIGATPQEIYFTSGATEGNNLALRGVIQKHGIKHVITSRLEHHAVLNPLLYLERIGSVRLSYVEHDSSGNLNLDHLESLLRQTEQAIVAIMHGNNEIGILNDIEAIADLCVHYNVLFHTDTVQTISHYKIDTRSFNITSLVASAHKFHGPKGVGFLYASKKIKLNPLQLGGGQERGLRAGTENVAGIAGLAKALEISHQDLHGHRQHIAGLKSLLTKKLRDIVPGITFNGLSDDPIRSLYTVLSASFPESASPVDVLSYLDSQCIYVSGGSACNSGKGHSHVQEALGADTSRAVVRFSLSRSNTPDEILAVSSVLKKLFVSHTIHAYDQALQP